MNKLPCLLTAWELVFFTTADGQISGIFSHGMVLQQGMPVPVWGTGKSGDDQRRHVVVTSKEVKIPAAVRFDWSKDPNGNLFNKNGLPATPFHTGSK